LSVKLESALAKLQDAHTTQDIATINTAMAELNTAFQSASQDIYNAANNGNAGAANQSSGTPLLPRRHPKRNATDVDFKEVK
jgi:molecular chaperone DnaK